MKILFISEFDGEAFDGLVPTVCQETAKRFPLADVRLISGFLAQYTYGGLRPSRILNYAVVYGRSLAALIRHRPQVVVVDTTPPLIQWWLALLGPLLGARVYIWLMDYHPEIEARLAARQRGFRWLATVLRFTDRRLLKRISGVVTLDQAMAETVRAQCPQVPVKVHPTWSRQGTDAYDPTALNNDTAEFRLVYVGNLGVSHGLEDLEMLLEKIDIHRVVKLLAVGGNAGGRVLLQQMADRLGVVCEQSGRLSWSELRERVNAFRPNYAVVLMDENKRGLLSPSKYATYLKLGLPILYLGPANTNADVVCREQGAGLAATHSEIMCCSDSFVESLLDAQVQQCRQDSTRSAYQVLSRFNERSFVELLYPWLTEALPHTTQA